ncbi:MAG: molybdenum cofactor guanylyltransferase [Planctomycetota bacterium]|nr:molybdenum cofactor guanylyltransferase [Planctomycetota bacterium]
MTPPTWPHTAVLLVGGRSQRMGRAKHDLRGPNNRTLLEVVLAAARDTAKRVIVSGPPEVLPDLDHVADRHPDAGPLEGIASVIDSGRDEQYLFLPCDMPRLLPSLLHRLVDALATSEAAVFEQGKCSVRPVLPLALRNSTAATIQRVMEQGTRSIHGLLKTVDPAVLPLLESENGCLFNINTPEEWDEYLGSSA